MASTSKWNAEQVHQQEKQCAELRLQSFSLDDIADLTGLPRTTVFNRIKRYFASQPPLDLDQYRTEILTQLPDHAACFAL